MRKASLGTVCIVLGVLLMLAAGGLYAYNRYEDAHAGAEAQTVVQDLEEKVVEKTETAAESTPEEMTAELPSVFVDGYDYVGVLTIPALDLRLPVMQDCALLLAGVYVLLNLLADVLSLLANPRLRHQK